MSLLPESSVGPLAGVATSCLWVASSLCFTSAGLRLGSTVVNVLRLALAVVMLALTYFALSSQWWPSLTGEQFLCLAVSGVIGLAVCDQCLFVAFVEIGPRRTQLVMTTSPLFAAVFGLAFLDETLAGAGLLGVALTLAGVAWVVTERAPRGADPFAASPSLLRRGFALATAAAALQAAGLWLAKRGMGHGLLPPSERLDPMPATYVRMVFGLAGMLPILALWWWRRRRRDPPRRPSRWTSGVALTALGAVGGPFLGVWLSLIATDRSPIGVAQTLCSLSPVLILPLVGPVYGERVSGRAVFGAVVAMVGSATLILTFGGG